MRIFKLLSFILLTCLLGFIIGTYIIIQDNNIIVNKLIEKDYIELINEKSKNTNFHSMKESNNNIFVYLNSFCETKALLIDNWHEKSKEIDSNIFIILFGDMHLYLSDLINVDKRYDSNVFILKDNSNRVFNHSLKDIGYNEAVFITNSNDQIIATFQGADVPESLIDFLKI